jgi:SAM-dependent methyltransferase
MGSSEGSYTHFYDSQFLDYATRLSMRSALRIIKIVQDLLPVNSVLDVGCAQGAWLRVWREAGVADVIGVDGDYVARDSLQVPSECFVPRDVSAPFCLDRQFDLVQCLEVAEHIPAERAETLVENITRHGRCILFSAAPPGQGGEFHVNEQPYDYWRDRFRQRGYLAVDSIRSQIQGDHQVAAWYRYNTFLYLDRAILADASPGIRELVVPDGVPLGDISPVLYRIRKAAVRTMPFSAQQMIARLLARTRS